MGHVEYSIIYIMEMREGKKKGMRESRMGVLWVLVLLPSDLCSESGHMLLLRGWPWATVRANLSEARVPLTGSRVKSSRDEVIKGQGYHY